MDVSSKVIPPHLNAEIYRTQAPGTDSVCYLEYISIHKDGSAIIGTSDLTGRYWNGGASIFKDVDEAQRDYKKAKKCISLTGGTNDGCFVESSSKVLLCDDNGSVSIWRSTPEDAWKLWEQDASAAEHDDGVLAVGCLDPGSEYVTVGADANIKVWDINDMICVRNYGGAHNMAIYGVAVRPGSKTSFASGALDGYVTLWDEGVEKPVIDLVNNDCGIRCLQWIDENKILYGDEAGILRLVDIRNTGNKLTIAEFPAPVHRLSVNPASDLVAVCCDNRIVSVYSLSEDASKLVYQDRQSHSNYVRGTTWDNNKENVLHTIGWDGEIKTHKLTN